MIIKEVSTGNKLQIEIIPVEISDFDIIKKNRFFFDWKQEKDYELFKLRIIGTNDILGLISFEKISDEWRVHVRLLSVSIENMGRNKKYDGIVGNLLAFVSKIAIKEFAELACVSLRPKTQLVKHYVEMYKMNITGITLSLEVPEILDLIKKYDHD